MIDNIVHQEWCMVFEHQLNNNFLMDSPKGKTAFACGVGFVLGQLKDHSDPDKWQQILDDLEMFVDAYMAETGQPAPAG